MPPYQLATLGYSLDRDEEVFLGCYECEHKGTLDLAALVSRLGREFPIPELTKFGRCQRCGARKAYVRISGYKPPSARY